MRAQAAVNARSSGVGLRDQSLIKGDGLGRGRHVQVAALPEYFPRRGVEAERAEGAEVGREKENLGNFRPTSLIVEVLMVPLRFT